MVGQDLDAGSHDQHHEKHIEKVLQLQPPGEAGIDGWCVLRDPGYRLMKSWTDESSRRFWAKAISRTNAAAPIGRTQRRFTHR
jgi:hypothetical protein